MPSCAFDRRVPVDVGQLAQAEAIRIGRRIRESVDDHRRVAGGVGLADAAVQLVIDDRAPVV